MKLHELGSNKGHRRAPKRVGRGQASGWGKTSARGSNGQNSRSGGGVRIGFEGGQLPLYRRLPKRGFNNKRFENRYAIINLNDIERLGLDVVTPDVLLENNVIKKMHHGLKILGDGELTKAVEIHAHKFSKAAIEKIEKVGGKVEVL